MKTLEERIKDNIPEDLMQTHIEVVYHDINVPRLKPIVVGDWIDLAVAKTYTLKAGEFELLDLGVSMKLPKGCEALVIPRSSTFMRYGVLQANSVGLIDESYCGQNDIWKFPALAMRDTTITAGTRICQFRIIPHQPSLMIMECAKFDGDDRGGFGSTGV